MALLRILFNTFTLALELALIAGAAWLGYLYPLIFAGVTLGLAFLLGFSLENARLRYELPFYFGGKPLGMGIFVGIVASGEALLKSVLAGLVAILTFCGTDKNRLLIVAIIFAGSVFIGSSVLRRLRLNFHAILTRWGYFRLGAPLGILFSVATSFLPPPSFAEIGRYITLDLPARPSIDQASELLYLLKSKFDEMVVAMLSAFLDGRLAKIVGTLASVNMLSGFVIAIYAVMIAEFIRRLETVGTAPEKA